MSEKLTAADIFNGYAQSDVYDNSCLYSDNALRAMEEYAAQQVRQITEERDKAVADLHKAEKLLRQAEDSITYVALKIKMKDFFDSITDTNNG